MHARSTRDVYLVYAIVTSAMLPTTTIIIIPYHKHCYARVALLVINWLILGVPEAAVHVVSIAMQART